MINLVCNFSLDSNIFLIKIIGLDEKGEKVMKNSKYIMHEMSEYRTLNLMLLFIIIT